MAKVLLIEDDPLVVRMYQKVLSFEGFKIDSAANGRDGLEKARQTKPDLIFLDVMMPKMNGIEVLEHLKADEELKDIPVVMLTNLSGTHDAENALSKGAFSYMVKSEYKPKEVAAKAKEFIAEGSQKTQPAAVPQAAATAAPSDPVTPPPTPAAVAPKVQTQPSTPPAAVASDDTTGSTDEKATA